jgi:hypothetical protein
MASFMLQVGRGIVIGAYFAGLMVALAYFYALPILAR